MSGHRIWLPIRCFTAANTASTSESMQIQFEHVRRWQFIRQAMSVRSTQISDGLRLPLCHHSVGPKADDRCTGRKGYMSRAGIAANVQRSPFGKLIEALQAGLGIDGLSGKRVFQNHICQFEIAGPGRNDRDDPDLVPDPIGKASEFLGRPKLGDPAACGIQDRETAACRSAEFFRFGHVAGIGPDRNLQRVVARGNTERIARKPQILSDHVNMRFYRHRAGEKNAAHRFTQLRPLETDAFTGAGDLGYRGGFQQALKVESNVISVCTESAACRRSSPTIESTALPGRIARVFTSTR